MEIPIYIFYGNTGTKDAAVSRAVNVKNDLMFWGTFLHLCFMFSPCMIY